ncbi:D-arabinono-1,4-lactone oxidase [Pichia californica]|uniref:D-arabinono-1,4-lactone oxidase n=1 Tax=Pichia californica TaxID=460514 RepID=A0A9P7BEZ2_9ASCO|nr:D-arabinono-1,4-lactone oxidase [[Candida] californica]KAG0689927.1 D-arabinono-1,4-lactone oxidase [[Candida] californica]
MSFTLPNSLAKIRVPRIHHTWANTYQCSPQYYFQPKCLDDIKDIVNNARKFNKKIMVVGSGHSPSDLTIISNPINEWLVNLDKYNKFLNEKTSIDGKYTDVTAEAGMRVYQLNEILESKGLAIQSLGSISEQSLAGIISTGTHGSSQYHGLVSSQVVNLKIINSLGNVINCNSHENPDIFRAATLSLGKIGIIIEVTFRTVPKFQLRSVQEVINLDTLIEKFDSIWTSDEFIRIWWFPYTKKCILWRASKSNEPISLPRKSWYGTFIGRFFYESLLYICVKFLPKLTPFVERFVFSRQYGLIETFNKNGDIAVQNSVDGLNMDCLFHQYVDEWACPLINGPDIIRLLAKSIEEGKKSNEFYVHSPIEIRCSNTTLPLKDADEIDISNRKLIEKGPIYGNTLRPYLDTTPKLNYLPIDKVTNSQLTMYINATIYRPFDYPTDYKCWFHIFEEIMEAAGGKPHWAKNYDETIVTKEKMMEWYGDDLIKWRKVRQQVDPDGVFLSGSAWLERNGIVEDSIIEQKSKSEIIE